MIRRDSSPYQVGEDVLRVTLPLPLGIDHVNCYLLRSSTDGWTLVDTGLGAVDAESLWQPIVGGLDGPIERIVITHFHPDHVGGAADVAKLAGAPVYQGRLDYEYCVRAWNDDGAEARVAEHLRDHGMPEEVVGAIAGHHALLAGFVHYARDPEPLEAGERLDGWEVIHLPGHADGHLGLVRDGVIVAGDALLGNITPHIGVYPGSRPDPLGEYLETLERLIELAPRVAFAGHGDPIEDPAGRARQTAAHHRERLEQTLAELGDAPRSAYDISLGLFPAASGPIMRRFAFAETLAHLDHLALSDRAGRFAGDDGLTRYRAQRARLGSE